MTTLVSRVMLDVTTVATPTVMIVVAQSAVPAHRRHGDIIPAPSSGCPTR